MNNIMFSFLKPQICYGGDGGGGGGGGGGGSRADRKGAQANLGGGGSQAQYSDRDDREQQEADQRRTRAALSQARAQAQAQAQAQDRERAEAEAAAQAQANANALQEAQAQAAQEDLFEMSYESYDPYSFSDPQENSFGIDPYVSSGNLYNQTSIPTDSEINQRNTALNTLPDPTVGATDDYPKFSFEPNESGVYRAVGSYPEYNNAGDPALGLGLPPVGQDSISQAVTNQLDGNTGYDNIVGTDAYQLNFSSPQNIDADILNPPSTILNPPPTGSLDPSPDSLINTFDSNPSFDGSDITSYLDDIGGDSFDPRGNQIGSPELPPSQFYAGMDGPTAQESFSPQFYAGMDGPEPSNLYNSSAIEDEMDFVPRQGPVQADPVAPPGDEMDVVPRQGPSPMTGFFEGDVDSGTEMDLSSQDANFYDEIPNDFANFTTPGNDSGMEMNLNSSDANFYDDIAFQPDPINDILAGEQFTTSAANVPASIPVQTADDGYGAVPKVPDQYDLAASESSRFEGFDTSPSIITNLALGTNTKTGTAIPTFDQITGTTGTNNNSEIPRIKFVEDGIDDPSDINPERLSTQSLLDSAYEKSNSGRTSELTAAEQAVLVGQRGQQMNPAEMTQVAQVYKYMGKIPMTQEFQDSIVKSMQDPQSVSEIIGGKRINRGATEAEIESYKKDNPIGEDINPNWKPFEELEGWEKVGRAIENGIKFAVKNYTFGILDIDKISQAQGNKYLSAYQDPGQTGGQFFYGSDTDEDITDDENFDRLVALSGTERGAEPILEGVMGSDGKLVRGFDRYKNTIDGVEKVVPEEKEDDLDGCPMGYVYDPVEEMCMPIIDDGADSGSGSPSFTIGKRPTPTQPDPRPPVVRPPSGGSNTAGLNFRKPKFFQDGGSVTPNIDSFLSGLR